MRMRFLLSNLKLVLLGVALGLLARLIFGDPIMGNGLDRKFNKPLDVTQPERFEPVSDFPIIPQ